MLIYKIFRADENTAFQTNGETLGAPIDLADGYVHLSTAEQVKETAAKHFAGEHDLVLLAVDPDRLGEDLKWEVSRGGADFPHLYRALKASDVVWSKPLPLKSGSHEFPDPL
ncbi:MAG: hypothetical protein CMK07_12960 [Ponticaulis sp.]|nr:hypothetical protein [Ponticaulis sp.]